MRDRTEGVLFAIAAYVLWGVLPIYWKALETLPALEILAHRMVWSVVFLLAVLGVARGWTRLRQDMSVPHIWVRSMVAACLLGVNWGTYIWGVNADRIVETSLGYYINPLVSVLLGVMVLRERLRPVQWMAVALAGIGVGYITVGHGTVPWVAVVLAFTFALYGLVKKTTPAGPLTGLTMETTILVLPAMVYLAQLQSAGHGAFASAGLGIHVLLVLCGLVTTLPLLLFGRAAKSIDLSTIGLLQYIAPTCGLLLGVFVYGEAFDRDRAIGFTIIWSALALYSADSFRYHRKSTLRGTSPASR